MFLGSFEDIVADLPGPLAEPSRLVDNQTGGVRSRARSPVGRNFSCQPLKVDLAGDSHPANIPRTPPFRVVQRRLHNPLTCPNRSPRFAVVRLTALPKWGARVSILLDKEFQGTIYGSPGMNVGLRGKPEPGNPLWDGAGGPLTVV